MSSGERGRAQSSCGNQQRTRPRGSSARMKMKVSVLLLPLLLLPLSAADSDVVRGCPDMWLEFTCSCTKCGNHGVKVKMPNGTILTSTHSNRWKDCDERLSLYHNTTKPTVRLLIKKLQMADFGKYTCFPTNTESSEEDEATTKQVKKEITACQLPQGFAQTAYRGVGTTITCNYPGNKLSEDIYLCKDNNTHECKESSRVSRTIQAGLSVAINEVSPADHGVYWCSFRKVGYQGAYRKIVLSVKDVYTHSATVTAGENFVYSSNYSSFNVPSGRSSAQLKKFLCKGTDPTTCSRWWNGEPEVSDNQELSSVTVTLLAVTPNHTGTYWCGARSEGRRSNLIFYRLQLQVAPRAIPPTLKTLPASSFCPSAREFWLAAVVAMVCIALLLSALTLTLVYIFHQRRKWRERVLHQPRHSQEETAYTEVEMQQPHHQAAPGIASKTIYSSAGAADLHDVPLEENGGDTYSVVKDSEQAPTYSTVGHPTGPLLVVAAAAVAVQDPSDDSTALYHTVAQH